MCLLNRDMPSKRILLIFLILAFLLLLPFGIVSTVLAYENSDDFCLSYAGMKDAGRHEITLRNWLKVDGLSRLIFFIIAVVFFIGAKYLGDHYALTTVQSGLFRTYIFCLLGWIILGAIIFWGDIQPTRIFEHVPTRQNYGRHFVDNNRFISNPNSQLYRVAERNSNYYYDYHRFERGPWFFQQLLPQWRAQQLALNDDEKLYDTYQSRYEEHPGFRYGCKPRVSVYMHILLILSLIALPIAFLLFGLRSNRTQYAPNTHTSNIHHNHHNVNVNHHHHTHEMKAYQNGRFHAHGPDYGNPGTDVRLRH